MFFKEAYLYLLDSYTGLPSSRILPINRRSVYPETDVFTCPPSFLITSASCSLSGHVSKTPVITIFFLSKENWLWLV